MDEGIIALLARSMGRQRPVMKRTLRDPMTLCSVCKRIIRPGILPASHGYCRACGEALLRELEEMKKEEEKT